MSAAGTGLATDGALSDEASAPIALAGETLQCDFAGCLYWPQARLLVVSDLHLEKGSAYARRGQLLPPYDTAATLAALAARIAFWQPDCVIALGDSFHEPRASGRLDAASLDAIGALMAGRDWIWIKGNHDPDPPEGIGGDCCEEIAIGPLVLRHEPLPGTGAGEISGHLHPHARIHRRGKTVRRRCFAHDGERLIMPAFGAYTGGLNIRHRAFEGLFAKERLQAVMLGRERVYAVAGRRLV